HRRSRSPAAALVGVRSALPLVLGHAGAGQLVRRIHAGAEPRRRAGGDVRRERRRAPGADRGARMNDGLHIVVSKPPDEVTDAEFNRWYDAHVDEILAVDGFSSVRRFRMEPVVGAGALPHRFIAVYETDTDPRTAVAALENAGLGS